MLLFLDYEPEIAVEPSCGVFASYAAKCSSSGTCVEWRNSELCPYSCPDGFVYKACGTPSMKTCLNYGDVTVLESKSVEGCFCPDDKVKYSLDIIVGNCFIFIYFP